ncbi:MAG: acyl-CoA-binding protein [Pseudomonadota bacterium]
MSELEQAFEQAQQDVKALTKRPSDDEMLKLYALYKQASSGDVSGSRPGMLDFVGRAKYDAWAKISGLDRDDAMRSYISTAKSLISTYGA